MAAAAPVKIQPAILSQGFINAYYVKVIANNDLGPEQIYEKLSALYGSKNPLLLVRQGSELRDKADIISKFQRIQSRGPIFVECLGFNGDYISLSGHPAGEPSPFHLVTWGTMKIGSQPAVPFTESFVLSGSRSGSSYSYSINRSVLLFPTLTTDIDDFHIESLAPADSSSPATPPSASDASAAPPASNRTREQAKIRTPRKAQEASDAPAAAAAGENPAKEKQEKQPAPTSYASAARMAPSAPKDDQRTHTHTLQARGGGGAAADAAASAPSKEAADEIPNGLIVKKIPDGIRLTKDFAEALFPGKRIASVLAIADKSHGFIYLVSDDDFRQLSLPSVLSVAYQGATISVTIDRKKPKSAIASRSGESRGRPQPHTDGFTQVAPRSRGRSDGHADGEGDGPRRAQGGRGGRGGKPTHH